MGSRPHGRRPTPPLKHDREGGAPAAHRVGRVVRPGRDLGPAHEGAAAAEAAPSARAVPDAGPSPSRPAASSAQGEGQRGEEGGVAAREGEVAVAVDGAGGERLQQPRGPDGEPGTGEQQHGGAGAAGPQAAGDTGREQQQRARRVAQEVGGGGDVPPGRPDPVRGLPDPGVRPPGPGVTGVPHAEHDDHERGEHGDDSEAPAQLHRQHRRSGHLAVRHRHRAAHPREMPPCQVNRRWGVAS